MNSSLNSSSNAVTHPNPLPSNEDGGINPIIRTCHIIICILAISGNSLTILMFAKERKLLKKEYNILILTLAIADVLTAINVITSPAFVLGDAFPYPTTPLLGEIVCRLIWGRAVIFHLVFFSVYITLFLTAERWCAVVKPYQYVDIFSRRKVLGYIFFSWVWSILLMARHLKDTVYIPSSKQICQFRKEAVGSFLTVFWDASQVSLKMLFPCLAIIGLYIHMIVRTKKSPFASLASKVKLRGKITRMVGVASVMLITLYIPNQVIYLLNAAGKAKFDTPFHHFTSLLTFMTTCINLFIYGVSNRNFQSRYRKIVFAMCPRRLRQGGRVDVTDAANDESQIHVRPGARESILDL